MNPQDTLASMQLARDALPILAIIAGAWTMGVAVVLWWRSRGRSEARP